MAFFILPLLLTVAEKKETRKKGIEFISKHGTEAFIKTLALNLFCDKSKNEKPELLGKLIELGKSISSEALIQYYHAMMARPDRTLVLKTFERPVLLIAGKSDSVILLKIRWNSLKCLPFLQFIS